MARKGAGGGPKAHRRLPQSGLVLVTAGCGSLGHVVARVRIGASLHVMAHLGMVHLGMVHVLAAVGLHVLAAGLVHFLAAGGLGSRRRSNLSLSNRRKSNRQSDRPQNLVHVKLREIEDLFDFTQIVEEV